MELDEILYHINKEKDLTKDNVIEKIKGKLTKEDKDEWEKANFDVNYFFQSSESSKSMLYLAIQNNLMVVANALIPKIVDVNAKDDEGTTLLHVAVSNNRESIVKALLEKGINVNAKDNNGKTPLHFAVRSFTQDMVDVLLEVEGIDVNVEDNNGQTPEDLDACHYIENFRKKEKPLNEEKNDLSQKQDNDDHKDTVHLLRKTESISAAKKGVFVGGATALLGTVAAVALFVTGTIAVELIPIVIAVATIIATALAFGGITYVMSKPSTEMNEVGDLKSNDKTTHL